MGCEVIWTESARRDVEHAVSHIAGALGSPKAATEHLDAFLAAAESISEFPEARAVARQPSLAARNLRPYFVKRYVLLYSYDGKQAVVHRIFHTLQDYAHLVDAPRHKS